MSKMIIMKGLPGCGKSTEAERIIREQGNVVRINKDLLRLMLHFDKFNYKNENITKNVAYSIAKTCLGNNINVIIDDTNLNPGVMQGWKDLAREMGAKVEVIDLTHVPALECVDRDTKREKYVGGTVIKNMAMRYGLTSFQKDNVVLCDIDGTISDTTHRLHFVQPAEGEKKNWKGFFDNMHLDPVRKDVQKMLVELYNQGYTIIFMSARPDTYKEVTLSWLRDNYLSFAYTLIMRQANDKRPDTETKRDMINLHFPDKGVIHAIFDDRPSIIRLWKDMGLNVIDVGKGVEF